MAYNHIKAAMLVGDRIEVIVECPFCKERSTLSVNQDGWRQWCAGKLIQHVLPELNSDQQESLISGVCHKCWEQLNG